MHDHIPSRTAFRVAMRRAAHQVFDDPKVLDDPLAVPILGPVELDADRSYVRAFMAARSRFAEDEIAEAVLKGVRQCVVLGAGLDTFAYRNPFPELRVMEVDHPATQDWKRQMLASAAIKIPDSMKFVPVDFAKQNLAEELRKNAFLQNEPTVFSWLGVVPYLTRDAAFATLRWIASLPHGSGVVFDYAVDPSKLNFLEKTALEMLSRRVARVGEPFQLFFEPAELAADLREFGFSRLEDLGAAEINARYFSNRKDGLKVRGNLGRLMSASVLSLQADFMRRPC